MSVDLDELLRRSADGPERPADPGALWERGRRRRRVRFAAGSAVGLAGLALAVVVPLGLAEDRTPTIDPIAPSEPADEQGIGVDDPTDATDDSTDVTDDSTDVTDDSRETDTAEPPEGPTSEELRRWEQRALEDAELARQRVMELAEQAEAERAAASPDPERLADPCAVHEGGEMRAFIDVVSPVEGQQVGGEVELVGCASVFEGTIQYRIVDGAGTALLEDFTTATAGGPEIGEFRETVQVPITGELYVEVYWEDQATGDEQHPDGPERDLVRIPIEAD